jgi:pimeloyl-ACP methyl ester carboxylesterase
MRRVAGDGVELALLDEGEGPAVLLLHGFPDSSYVWRKQVPALVEAGFRVLAPDLRGFGDSDRPEAVEDYRITRSLGDVRILLGGLGIERAHVVGHDYGAGLAWVVAGLAPELVDRLAVLSVGHPSTYRSPSVEQRERFWYQLFFLHEGVAEELLARDDWALMREFSRGDGDQERWHAELSRPGALTAALNWYRANAQPARELSPRPFPKVAARTLGIWSSGDHYLLEEAMLASAAHVTGEWRYERIDGASHWLQLDAPGRVNELLLEFLTDR